MQETKTNNKVLPVIVLSQFAGTSLWFAGNAILPELKQSLQLSQYALSLVTTAVMLGFICGSLVFAFFTLADRYSPVKLFLLSAILGSLSNISVVWLVRDGASLFAIRFVTGFFLAGIYPVGMKIAADWYKEGLGKALGYLVGALVLGTAFPHLLRNRDFALPWKAVLYCTSAFATAGGLLMYWLGDGPHRKQAGRFQWNAIPEIFRSKKWRQAAFGYFGHMWELYTFWGFVPLLLGLYAAKHKVLLNIPLFSFLIIASGSLSCVLGGYLSRRAGNDKVAFAALLVSGVCCLVSPLVYTLPPVIFLAVLFCWGCTVVPDSPQFSSLVAQYAPEQLRGTALTIYNSIGFAIATVSLQVTDRVFHSAGWLGRENTMLLLGAGALFGLPSLLRLIQNRS
ncbi:MAG: MFS transporter [Chitinophagaceae bacterium]